MYKAYSIKATWKIATQTVVVCYSLVRNNSFFPDRLFVKTVVCLKREISLIKTWGATKIINERRPLNTIKMLL